MRAKSRARSTLPYWILALAGAGAIAAIAYVGFTADDRPQLDPVTRCPIDVGKYPPSRTTVVIVDRTEALNEVQQRDVLNTFDRELLTLPRERLILYELIGSSDVQAKPLLERCNPVQPVGESIAAKLERDEALESKEFREKFLKQVGHALAHALETGGTTDSPLMELIQAAAVRDLKNTLTSTAKRLIVISDLMQNSRAFSQYGHVAQADFFRSRVFSAFQTNLAHVDVLVLYIKRTSGPSTQPEGHKAFWEKYFALQGAQVGFIDIEGAAWSAQRTR